MEKMNLSNKKSIILGLLIIVVVSFATGCGFYNLVDTKEFKEHFGALGYSTSDTETPLYDTAESYVVATKSDVPFKIEYYEFESEVEAKKVYVKYTDSIVDYITTNSKDTEVTGAVYAKWTSISQGEYIKISRVKNTLIFINGTVEFKDEIDKLLEDIKY